MARKTVLEGGDYLAASIEKGVIESIEEHKGKVDYVKVIFNFLKIQWMEVCILIQRLYTRNQAF